MIRFESRMPPGNVALPNGLGLAYPDAAGTRRLTGAPPNELAEQENRDAFAGTPWHGYVPARLDPVSRAASPGCGFPGTRAVSSLPGFDVPPRLVQSTGKTTRQIR